MSSRKTRRTLVEVSKKINRSVFEVLERRQMMAADPAFLVHWQGNVLQSNNAGLTIPLQPSTTSYQNATYQGITTQGDYDGLGGSNDYRYGFPLSDTTPLSPDVSTVSSDSVWGIYNGTSAKFYGGIIATEYNAPGFTNWGDYPQVDANGGIWSRQGGGAGSGRNFESLVYWKKEDFLTQDNGNTTLDLAKAYFNGTFTQHSILGRWVIRDGSQFYVSKDPIINSNANAADTAPNKFLQASDLSSQLWAAYNPTSTDLHFDASGASFTTPTSAFTNITAVGYFAQKEYSETQSPQISATAGTFTVTFDGKTTPAIPFNAGIDTDPTKSIVSFFNDTFGYFNLRAYKLDPNGANNISNLGIAFNGGNQSVSIYAYTDVPPVVITFDAAALTAGATANVIETAKGGSAIRYNDNAEGWMGVTKFDVSRSGRQEGDNLAVSTASFLGGSTGISSINSSTVAPDNTIWLAGTLATDPAGPAPTNLLGGGAGTIVHLNAAGTTVLSITHIGTDIVDMQVRPDGSVALAVSGIGPVVLNSTATAVVWSASMTNIRRITVGTDGMVGALSTTKSFAVYSSTGTLLKSGTFGNNEINDIVLDAANQRFIVTGANYYTNLVVKIPFIKAYDYSNVGLSLGATGWVDYDWANSITNTYYGQVLSDSVGDRLTIGGDGYLYFAGHADGGASIFNFDPVFANNPINGANLVGLDGTRLIGFDTYARPGDHANAATHYTFLAKLNLNDGALLKANWELAVNGSSKKGNTVNASDLVVGADGRVYVTGAEASEQANRDGLAIDDISLSGYNGFETFVMVLSPNFAGRERWNVFTTGDPSLPGNPDHHGSGGNTIAIAPNGNVIVGGFIYSGRIYTTANAIQPTVTGGIVGGGANVGYFTVLPPISPLPSAPTKLAVQARDAYQVSLQWQDNATSNTGTYVERSKDAINWTQIAAISSASVSGYWDETVDRQTTYYYRVRSYNASGTSAYSNIVTVTTPGLDRGPFNTHLAQDRLYSMTAANNTIAVDANLKYTIHAQNNPWVNGSGLGGWGINRGEKYAGLIQKVSGDATVVVHRTSDSIDQSNFVQSGISFQESLVRQANGKVASLVTGQVVQWDGAAQTYAGSNFNFTSNPWWKLSRSGDTFTGSYSADGITWTQAGQFTMVMPQDLFVVIAGHASYDGANTYTGGFDNVIVNHVGGTEYSNDHDENVYVKAVAIPVNVAVSYDGANNTAFTNYFQSNGNSNYQQFWNATAGIGGGGAVGAIPSNDATAVYKTKYGFSNAQDTIVASQFVKLQAPTLTNQITGLGLVSNINGRLGGGSGTSNEYFQLRLRWNASGYYEWQTQANGATIDTSASHPTLTVGNWYKQTTTYTNLNGTTFNASTVLEDFGPTGTGTPVVVSTYSYNNATNSTLTTAAGAYIAYRGFTTGGAQYYDNFAVTYSSPTNSALTRLQVFQDLGGAPSGTPTYAVQKSAIDSLLVDLKGGSDTLTVDYTGLNPTPASGITFDGGDGLDTLRTIGTGNTDAFAVSATQVTHGAQVPVSYANTETLQLDSGDYTAAADIAGKNVFADGSKITFDASQHLLALGLSGGTKAAITAGGEKNLVVTSVAVAGAGSQLDLTDNALIVDYSASSPLAAVSALINSGRNGYDGNIVTNWDGVGIMSSLARANSVSAGFDLYSLGAINNADLADGSIGRDTYSVFRGQTVDASSVIVRYTYSGDADLNGFVDGDDYALIDNAFNLLIPNFGWMSGDFNYDTNIDGDDYALIDSGFLFQGAPIL